MIKMICIQHCNPVTWNLVPNLGIGSFPSPMFEVTHDFKGVGPMWPLLCTHLPPGIIALLPLTQKNVYFENLFALSEWAANELLLSNCLLKNTETIFHDLLFKKLLFLSRKVVVFRNLNLFSIYSLTLRRKIIWRNLLKISHSVGNVPRNKLMQIWGRINVNRWLSKWKIQ